MSGFEFKKGLKLDIAGHEFWVDTSNVDMMKKANRYAEEAMKKAYLI